MTPAEEMSPERAVVSRSPVLSQEQTHDEKNADTACSCAKTYATYEGPEADCPVHGAVRALNDVLAETRACKRSWHA